MKRRILLFIYNIAIFLALPVTMCPIGVDEHTEILYIFLPVGVLSIVELIYWIITGKCHYHMLTEKEGIYK